MKRSRTIIGILLVFLIAGNACHNPRHNSRDMRDSEKMIRMRMGQNFRHIRGMPGMRGMMGQGMRNEMMRNMDRMPMDSIGWIPVGPGRMMLESIPNVTENQKKIIKDLTKKNIDEMKKIREEMFSKMQSLMDSQRKEILSILTDEQKKFIQSGRSKPSPDQEDAK